MTDESYDDYYIDGYYVDESIRKRNKAIRRLMEQIINAKDMKREIVANGKKEYEILPASEEAKAILLNTLEIFLKNPFSTSYPIIEKPINEKDDEGYVENEDDSDLLQYSFGYFEDRDIIFLTDPSVFIDRDANYKDPEEMIYRIFRGKFEKKPEKGKKIS